MAVIVPQTPAAVAGSAADCLAFPAGYTADALMGASGPVQFEVKEQVPTTVVVTTSDGQKYDLVIAILIHSVSDQGVINPIDGMPILQVASQPVMQVKRHADD